MGSGRLHDGGCKGTLLQDVRSSGTPSLVRGALGEAKGVLGPPLAACSIAVAGAVGLAGGLIQREVSTRMAAWRRRARARVAGTGADRSSPRRSRHRADSCHLLNCPVGIAARQSFGGHCCTRESGSGPPLGSHPRDL